MTTKGIKGEEVVRPRVAVAYATNDGGAHQSYAAREYSSVEETYDDTSGHDDAARSGDGPPVAHPVSHCLTNSSTSGREEETYADSITCFSLACAYAGVPVHQSYTSVAQLSDYQRDELSKVKHFKVYLLAYGQRDTRNHVELVFDGATSYHSVVRPAKGLQARTFTTSVTSMQHFFQRNSEWYNYRFFADQGDGGSTVGTDDAATVVAGGGFGGAYSEGQSRGQPSGVSYIAPAMAASQQQYEPPSGATTGAQRQAQPRVPPPESIVDDSFTSGAANVSGGVVRSSRRKIKAVVGGLRAGPARNYNVTGVTMFNNFDELFQDSISRELAQEIIEDLFEVWGLPMEQPETMKYAEDLLLSFMIATTASNKADYHREAVIPVRASGDSAEQPEVVVNFTTLSGLLESKYNVTRRQFSRGMADDQRSFLLREENNHLRPVIATRVGCEPALAHLGFDGSTHCTGMTTREQSFTRTLESRNLFEMADVVAQGASDKLMQGFSSGTRSVVSR